MLLSITLAIYLSKSEFRYTKWKSRRTVPDEFKGVIVLERDVEEIEQSISSTPASLAGFVVSLRILYLIDNASCINETDVYLQSSLANIDYIIKVLAHHDVLVASPSLPPGRA